MKYTFKSPLRYPGGKSRMISKLTALLPANLPALVSPFVGGGSVELAMAANGAVVHAYDHDDALVCFWQELLRDAAAVSEEARKHLGAPVEEFTAMQKRLSAMADSAARAGLYYAVNRMSFSGMTKHGGASPTSDRFTVDGVNDLAKFKNPAFNVGHSDYRDSLAKHPGLFAFLDPPYMQAENLYDGHADFNHDLLFGCLKDRRAWLMTYDDCDEVRDLYADFPILQHDVRWALSDRTGSEVIIGSRDMADVLGVTMSRATARHLGTIPAVAANSNLSVRTADQWAEIGKTSRIGRNMHLAKLAIGDVVNKSQRFAIIIGSPGVGKTQASRGAVEAWQRRGLTPIHGQPANKQALLSLLSRSRGVNPLILDEADILFRSNAMTEVLKLATDPNGPGFIEGKTEGARIPLTAPMVLLGNFRLQDLDPKHQTQARALFDRQSPVEIIGDTIDLYDWTVHLALTTSLIDQCDFGGASYCMSLADLHDALEWFRLNLWNLKSVSPRTLQKVAGWFFRVRKAMGMTSYDLELRLADLVQNFPQMQPPPPPHPWTELRMKLKPRNGSGLLAAA